jgi:superfamily I DNA/RNA helicase
MAKLIGTNEDGNFGEKFFVTKAIEYFDEATIIYRNRQIYGREFDVCILMPGKGILVVELKGWKEENVLRVENNDHVVIRTSDGEISASPQKQARGYRFSLERHIKQSIDKFPLVFQLVCLPQVSKEFFRSHRLDVVMEERFTILKEDLTNNTAFFTKLDQALRETITWHRDPFDKRTMLEVRNLFETGIDLSTKSNSTPPITNADFHQHDYSRFLYCAPKEQLSNAELQELVTEYLSGCKIYGVLSDTKQLFSIAQAIDGALSSRGLIRDGSNLEYAFESENASSPAISSTSKSFNAFHITLSVANHVPNLTSFSIANGNASAQQISALKTLSNISSFNVEQYLVEHADANKNIVIRAGAGTGKTYTMISRIAYVCYTQNVTIQKMADRIVMITFTNEAADQMERKLKNYFKNCYLLTSNAEYLSIISRVDSMQISTIHSYAKQMISQLGTSFGYGIDLGITSSEYNRRRKISDILDSEIKKNAKKYGGAQYVKMLGMPVYAIRENILDFIEKLHNMSVNISEISAADFGSLSSDDSHIALHELLASVIPQVEREYVRELQEENKVHLSTMMSMLSRFINAPENEKRIKELKKDKNAQQFLFVDEFQDTDDSQIESLLKIADCLDYRLFVVGDIKQCIYRFRGADEEAFNQLGIEKAPDKWLDFSLQRNYRTDSTLLDIFDHSFSAWGSRADRLLAYQVSASRSDRLIGTKDYNSYLASDSNRFYRRIPVQDEDRRIPALVEEIKRIQRWIAYEKEKGLKFSPEECSIAILVRENWQAEMVRKGCSKLGITNIQTNTGGDLYMSQPALDMMTLINALVNYDQAEYLYNLAVSNFFNLDIPKSNMFEIRMKIRTGGWRAKADEHEQVNYLIKCLNPMLANTEDQEKSWELVVESLRTKPILQAIRSIYSRLEPWKKYAPNDTTKQHYYQLNVDLLFEQLINACNVDRLTINTLREQLYNSIIAMYLLIVEFLPKMGKRI